MDQIDREINGIGSSDKSSKLFTRAADKVSAVAGRADKTMSELSDKAQEFGTRTERTTDSALGAVGDRMTSIASSIRENTPSSGLMGSAARSVADTVQSSGEYLETHGLRAMAGDVTGVVRRHPVSSLWVGLGVGVLLGRAFAKR